MKSSNDFINEKVFKTNKKYADLQNKTEELFFECLDNGYSVEYFNKKLDEIWGNIDHSFINEDIEEYVNLIEINNLYYLEQEQEEEKPKIPYKLLLGIALGAFMVYELKYADIIKKRYATYYNSPEYKKNKEEYLKNKVSSYDNQVIPYFNKNGEIVRYVQLSTYLAMKYNTALTRAGWERTIEAAEYLGYKQFWIPPHSFSCENCVQYQGRILELEEVLQFIENADEQEGDILHPNCKCEILIYTPLTKLQTQNLTNEEIEQQYHIRQKVNSLTLKKERILTEMKIQKKLGNQDEVDRLNAQRNKINSQIRELVNSLPNQELKTKVIAINR